MVLIARPRRLRHDPRLRELVAETRLHPHDFVQPLFVTHEDVQSPILSMPGQFQWGLKHVGTQARRIQAAGVSAIMLFGLPKTKDPLGSEAYTLHGIVPQAIAEIKRAAPGLYIMADVCFCQYMDHGHCGVMNHHTGNMDLDNDASLELIAKQALILAQAGADLLAPSGMLDGAVGAMRHILDHNGYPHLPLMGYTAKYASALYGPFREATQAGPQWGDRRSYQMDIRNGAEALKEAHLEVAEGVDCLMVKPALYYLDVVHRLSQAYPMMPIAAYQVSGEYAMLKAAIEKGWLAERTIVESLIAIKRAGASLILSYFSEEIVPKLEDPSLF